MTRKTAKGKGAGNPPPAEALANVVFDWGLIPLRAYERTAKPDPNEPQKTLITYKVRGLSELEDSDFLEACRQIADAAAAQNLDVVELGHSIAHAMEKGASIAVSANAIRGGRLSPKARAEYRKRAAETRGFAQWLSKEIAERPLPGISDGVVLHNFSEGDDRNPKALFDLLRQRLWAPLHVSDLGAEIKDSAFASELRRVVDTINNLHWLAGLLREDASRARPQGAALAPWKHTARLLRELFENQLGSPLLGAVGTLAGLAHQCDVPAAELSKLSKP